MIRAVLNRFYLPLFSRDLIQMAGRKSTYVSRFIFILGLLIAFYFFSGSSLSMGDSGPAVFQLGVGGRLFETLYQWESVAILLLTPLLCCGAIAQEKERDALETLLLTRLSPWKIVLEKYLSRIFPLLLFLLCTLPLLVYLYSLGGVTMFDIWFSFYLMILTILQLGAFTVMCSSYSNTSMGALIYTVFAVIIIYIWSSLMIEVIVFRMLPKYAYAYNLFSSMDYFRDFPRSIIPADQFSGSQRVHDATFSQIINMLILKTGMIWLSIFAALGMARYFLVRRVSVRTQNVVYAFFKKLDTFFNSANQITGGVVLIPENESLPLFAPVAWKEIRKTAIGTARYRIRVLVLLEFPTLFACLIIAADDGTGSIPILSSLLWGVISLLLVVKTTSLITTERLHQTLDVILVSPMSGREILTQKQTGVQGFCFFLAIPLLTVIFFKTYMMWASGGLSYFFYATISMAIMLYALIWICMYAGLRIKNTMRAVFSSLGFLAAWFIIPLCLQFIFRPNNLYFGMYLNQNSSLYYLMNLSPAWFFVQMESASLFDVYFFIQFLIAISSAAGMALFFRFKCFEKTDHFLGRQTAEKKQPPAHESPSDTPEQRDVKIQTASPS